MDTLFYKKNFRIIREKLEPELKRLMASRENYAKLVGYLVVAEDHRFFMISLVYVGQYTKIYLRESEKEQVR